MRKGVRRFEDLIAWQKVQILSYQFKQYFQETR